jgi:hypothetical protein
MRRRITIGLLLLGTIGGYAAGLVSMRRHAACRRESFEQHVASVCVEAARRDDANRFRDEARAR